MKLFPALFASVCFFALTGTSHSQNFVDQPVELAPVKTKDGIHFQFVAPDAEYVFLAGSFNNWADNNEGEIKDERFSMLKDKSTGIWSRYVAMEKGVYFMKFVVDPPNAKQKWVTPEYWISRDHSKNAMFWITSEGNIYFQSKEAAKFPTKASPGQATFSLYAPGVKSVHVAGKFNNWADNQDGTVTSSTALMKGPDTNGVWTHVQSLPPGQHSYQFVLDGSTWVQDPNQQAEDAEKHSVIVIE